MQSKGLKSVQFFIVVLIIGGTALYLTPKFFGTIQKIKKDSFEKTVEILLIESYKIYNREMILDKKTEKNYLFKDSEMQGDIIPFNGKVPENGYIKVNDLGEIDLLLHDGEYCARKKIDEIEIDIQKISYKKCLEI